MKKYFIVLFVIFLVFQAYNTYSGIIYIDPAPNAKYVNVKNTVVIGFDKKVINFSSVTPDYFSVTGSKSGIHKGSVKFTSGNTKIIFTPDAPFYFDEDVSVTLKNGIKLKDNSETGIYSYSFKTQFNKPAPGAFKGNSGDYIFSKPPVFLDNPIKDILPFLSVNISNNPAPGKIFMSNFSFSPAVSNTIYLLITENTGEVYSYIGQNFTALDFKKQPNGNLTYFKSGPDKFYELDINYHTVDSFYTGNGYPTDGHELRLLPDRHALMMVYDTQTVDMSQLVVGGKEDCLVIGLVIQEIDAEKNVVFQWRSWDYIPITEAQHQDLTADYIDYIHGNAIELDNDGHYLISSRHLDEITKINRYTGDIIWRLGGPGNVFTFINDPDDRFYYQHGIRRLPNGNIILFDNGNFHSPPHSRAVEYTLNETDMTATLAWQYRNTPDIFGFAMGFAQRLENGNTLISWGATNPSVTEVTPSGEIALEMSLPQGVFTYRAFKDDWGGSSIGIEPPPLYFVPVVYDLRQNYPNPFNPVTKIEVDIPSSTFANLSVYDILGRLVKTVVNGELDARRHVYELNSTDFAAGVYFYTLRAGGYVQTKKLVVLK